MSRTVLLHEDACCFKGCLHRLGFSLACPLGHRWFHESKLLHSVSTLFFIQLLTYRFEPFRDTIAIITITTIMMIPVMVVIQTPLEKSLFEKGPVLSMEFILFTIYSTSRPGLDPFTLPSYPSQQIQMTPFVPQRFLSSLDLVISL